MAQFEGDPASVDQLVAEIKQSMESDTVPPGLEGVQRLLLLVDRESGKTANVIFCETEDDLKKAHEALNQMSPDSDTRRTSVELYEVAIDGRMS
jgi:hypothetical protein